MKRQRGAAAVEMALVLPLLMLLVLGALDWGYYFFVSQIVTNASREAARVGTLAPQIDDGIADANATAAAYLTLNGLDASLATIDVTPVGDAVRVELSYPVGSLTGYAEIVVPDAARARAEMRR